jgi:hypothetical protein
MDNIQNTNSKIKAQEKLEREAWASCLAAEYSAQILDKFNEEFFSSFQNLEVQNVNS